MNALIPFQFGNKEIRIVRDENGDALFVGKDVCEALGYANPNKSMGDHCKGITKRYPLQTAGGLQEARVLSEPDVLRLIVNCSLPAAQAFERLVFEEILPAIRKTGSYSAPVALSDAERFLQSAQLFVAMEHRAVKMEQAQAALSARLDAVAGADQVATGGRSIQFWINVLCPACARCRGKVHPQAGETRRQASIIGFGVRLGLPSRLMPWWSFW